MGRLADMTPENVKPVRVALAHQHRRRVQRRAGRKSQPPQVQTHSDHQGEVPLRMANVRGAPPMRIGWVSATWSGTS